MKSKYLLFPLMFSLVLFIGWKTPDNDWIVKTQNPYGLYYTSADNKNLNEYQDLIDKGLVSVKSFFNYTSIKQFNVFIHPNRNSLDTTWQKQFKMPDFKSQCWMVASGVATRLDAISPKMWEAEACEHTYSNTRQTQNLITHELVHVYHGQMNASGDFATVEGIDWFVEGLAAYASGQCDSLRISQVKKAITDNKLPNGLDNFWTGKLKYGLSGSVVMFIDNKYGRNKLKELLPLTNKLQILSALNTTETELINNWKKYLQKL